MLVANSCDCPAESVLGRTSPVIRLVVQETTTGTTQSGFADGIAAQLTVILYEIESITMFTLPTSAHSAATGAPRHRFHRLDPGRLSGKFGSDILQLRGSPLPGGALGSYILYSESEAIYYLF